MKQEKVEICTLPSNDARNQLVNALNKIDGVKHASVTSDTVKVTYDEPASAQQIQHCISGAGNKIK